MPKRFKLTSPPPPRLSENDVERACIDLLRVRGYLVIRQHAGRAQYASGRWLKLHETGTPDYATQHRAYPGFQFEVKRPGAHPTPEQSRKHSEITRAYGIAVVVIDNVRALIDWLNEYELKVKQRWHDYALSNPAS